MAYIKQHLYLELSIAVTLVPDKLLGPLLHNVWIINWSDRHFGCKEEKLSVASGHHDRSHTHLCCLVWPNNGNR